MKILFVTPEMPHTLGGGASRMYEQLKYLKQEKVSVDLICHADINENNPDDISANVNKIYFVDKPNNGLSQRLTNLFLFRAYTKDKNFLKLANRVLSENKYDLIHVHKFQMAEYSLNIKNVPVVIDLWACGLKGAWYEVVYETNIFKKFIKLTRIPRFYISDIKFYSHFKHFFVVSDEAKKYILDRHSDKKVYVVPNGVEIESSLYTPLPPLNRGDIPFSPVIKEKNPPASLPPFAKGDRGGFGRDAMGGWKNVRTTKFIGTDIADSKNLIFTGDMSFFQNVDACVYFVKNIYPKIKKEVKDVKFYIVGRNPSKDVLKLAKEDTSITVTGFVENIYEYLKNSNIFVAPIRTGLGIRNKILEALACGLPVVATKHSYEGIEVIDNYNAVIADNPNEFAQKTVRLLNNPERREELGLNARKIIEEKYQWKNIVKKIIYAYKEIISQTR